jgi:hypothetical protein
MIEDEKKENTRYLTLDDLGDFDSNEKNLKDNRATITDLKKDLVLYRGVANIGFNNEPSVSRNLRTSKVSLSTFGETNYYDELKKLDFFKTYENIETNISMLARSQHYGYNSRLLDVSYRKLTAIYFASSKYFETTGKVYSYSHVDNQSQQTSIKVKHYFYFNPNSVDNRRNITRKMLLLSKQNNRIINNLNYISEIEQIEKSKNIKLVKEHLTEAVIIIDKNEFYENNASNDIRYESQKGLFILFGNKEKNGMITNEIDYQTIDSRKAEHVHEFDKLVFLYELANRKINFVTIYPDSDISHKINRVIKMLKVLNGGYSKNLNDILDTYNNEFNIPKVKKLIQRLIQNKREELVQFLLSDFYEFAKVYREKKCRFREHQNRFARFCSSDSNEFMDIIN